MSYQTKDQTCTVTLRQHNPPVGIEKLSNPPQPKPPLHIPFALGLLRPNGQALPITHEGNTVDTIVLELCQEEQSWTFTDIPEQPVPSLLRHFSAPVIVEFDRSDADLALLARHDSDPFARWEAAQTLASRQLLALVQAFALNKTPEIDPHFIATWCSLLDDASLTAAYKARVLSLPSQRELLEKTTPMDPLGVVQASRYLRAELGKIMVEQWLATYHATTDIDQAYQPDPLSSGRRALKNLALNYLMAAQHPQAESLALAQYYDARNMTDRMGGLSALTHYSSSTESAQALEHFYEHWQQDALVIDKWFTLQAVAPTTSVEKVRALMVHPAFSMRNPNRARALIFQFCLNNLQGVHSDEGYAFWAEQVLALDQTNPEIAARLARTFDNWARFGQPQRDALRQTLEHIQQQPKLSPNVSEIISKALNI